MHVGIEYGSETVELDVAPERLLVVHRQPEVPTLTDPEAAIAEAVVSSRHLSHTESARKALRRFGD